MYTGKIFPSFLEINQKAEIEIFINGNIFDAQIVVSKNIAQRFDPISNV